MTERREISPDLIGAKLKSLGYEEFDAEGPSGATWVDPTSNERPSVLVPRDDLHNVRGFSELIDSQSSASPGS